MSRSLKATALICVLCLFLTVPALAAESWTVLKPADHISYFSREDDIELVYYAFEQKPMIQYRVNHEDGTYRKGTSVDYCTVDLLYSGCKFPVGFDYYPLGSMPSFGPPLSNPNSGGIAIDAHDFKPNAAVTIMSTISLSLEYIYATVGQESDPDYAKYIVYSYLAGYDDSGNYLTRISDTYIDDIRLDPRSSPMTLRISRSLDFSEFQSEVSYIVPYFQISLTLPGDSPDIEVINVKFDPQDFVITMRTDWLKQNSLTMQAIENQLEDLNDKQDQTNDKLDELLQQPEQEKQEASSSGGDAADELISVIPDHSQGFMSAIRELADSMSYDGTDATLTFPSITLPEIPGVMKKYVLSKPYLVDFGFWIRKMPDKLLTLVQVLGTLALVVYSFKELYGTLSYALTLKGGNADG